MPLPLPLMVPAAYYYYYHHHHHHQHQHLLHSSSYSSYNSCPAMPKCVAGTWIRPRVFNPMALSKAWAWAWACKASPVALQWRAEPAGTGACIRPPETAAAAHSCHGNPASGVGSLLADLNWTRLCCTVRWWSMMGSGKGRVSHVLPASPICHHEDKNISKWSMPPEAKCSSEKRQNSSALQFCFYLSLQPHTAPCWWGGVMALDWECLQQDIQWSGLEHLFDHCLGFNTHSN